VPWAVGCEVCLGPLAVGRGLAFSKTLIVITFPKAVLAIRTVVEIAAAVHMCMQGGTYGE